jgi:NADH:ubiquinone oxidoreductase subunit H
LFFVSLLLVVSFVVGMAFVTLLEHRALGYIPFGRGLNRVAFVGILQALRHVGGLLSSDWYT